MADTLTQQQKPKPKQPVKGEVVTFDTGAKDKEGRPITVQQVTFPPETTHQGQGPVYLPPEGSWEAEQHVYLTSKGWERQGTNFRGQTVWKDPVGSNAAGELKVGAMVPSDADRMEGKPLDERRLVPIMQHHVPPLPWPVLTERAVMMQRARDAANEDGSVENLLPSQRIERLEQRLNNTTRRLDILIGQTDAMSKNERLNPAQMRALLGQAVKEALGKKATEAA